jgi:tRNA-Thr(GGU) m(6)t(6)A37 methyltransferase TsaA
MSGVQLQIIGTIESCYKERYGVPRQPGLSPAARSIIVLPKTSEFESAVRGLEVFSHIWVIFLFHVRKSEEWSPTVRPPRLGGAKRLGVFATRSPDRPNPVGLSAVKLEEVRVTEKRIEIEISGGDFVDGTPVVDFKPYIPYCDAIQDARGAWSDEPIPRVEVVFSSDAERRCKELMASGYPRFRDLIIETLSLDPRPAFIAKKSQEGSRYGVKLLDFDVRWEVEAQGRFKVVEIVAIKRTTKG